LEDLLERVFDLRCEMGDVFHSTLSVPSVWAALKLMPMGTARSAPARFPLRTGGTLRRGSSVALVFINFAHAVGIMPQGVRDASSTHGVSRADRHASRVPQRRGIYPPRMFSVVIKPFTNLSIAFIAVSSSVR